MSYAREVAPASVIAPLDSSLQRALLNKGTAATAVAISVAVAPYGTTGVLEAARRALNVVFEIESGRGFCGASWSMWRPRSCSARSCSCS